MTARPAIFAALLAGAATTLPLILPPPVAAQSIEMESLDEARAFAPGIEIDNPLPTDSWAGTPPERAVRLMADMAETTRHPIARDMLRRVILAGIAPPQGAGAAFDRARIQAAQSLATPDEYARFAARNPAAMDPLLRADAAVARGDLQAACEISDSVLSGRGDSDWVRLRAACHDLRGETASAELARELLRDRNEPDTLDIPDAPDPFWSDVMRLDAAALETRMTALARDATADLADEDLARDGLERPADDAVADDVDPPDDTPTELGPRRLLENPSLLDPAPESLPSDDRPSNSLPPTLSSPELYDIEAALADPSPQGTARLFVLARQGSARAVAAFVGRAEAAGYDPNIVLPRLPALLDPSEMADIDLPLFARYAVSTNDTGLLGALFEVTESPVLKQRLALASDALGGGFIARPLGDGLEANLAQGGPTVVTDVLIALALGAELSENAEAQLRALPLTGGFDADWIAVDQAVDLGARAEAMLRLAAQVDGLGAPDANGWTLYRTLRALRDIGHADLADRLAAYEFLRGL